MFSPEFFRELVARASLFFGGGGGGDVLQMLCKARALMLVLPALQLAPSVGPPGSSMPVYGGEAQMKGVPLWE